MNISKILKTVIWVGLLVLLITPFIVSGNLLFPYIAGKAYLFRITTEIIFFVWVILAVLDKKYRPLGGSILYAFIFFLISIFISNYGGVDPLNSFWSNYERMEGYVTLVHLFGLFLVFSSVLKSKTEWGYFLNASVASSIVMFFVALVEITERGFNARIDTTLGNSTYLAIFMLINFFLTLYLLVQKIKVEHDNGLKNFLKSHWFYIYSVIGIGQIFIIFQTNTRGAIVGLGLGLLIFAILTFIFEKKMKAVRYISGAIVLLVVIFVTGLFSLKDTPLVKHYDTFNRLVTISPAEGTAKARILNWQIAFEGIKERPIFGWGQSNFNYVFDKYYLPEHYGNEAWFDRVHNIIFDWTIAGGIVGLVLYLSIWFFTLYSIWFRKNNFKALEKSALTGLLVAYFVHNFFVFDQIVSYILFIVIISYVHSQSGTEIAILQKDLPKETSKSLSYVIVSLSIILIPITIWSVNIKSYAASTNLIKSMMFITRNTDGTSSFFYKNGLKDNLKLFKIAIEDNTFGNPEIIQSFLSNSFNLTRYQSVNKEDVNEVVSFSIDEMEKLAEKKKTDARYSYILGSFLLNLGQFDLAEPYLKRTVEISPKKQSMRIPLIRLYGVQKRGDEAVALAKETYELDTSKDDLWMEYMSVLQVYKKEEFDKMFQEAMENNQEFRIERLLQGVIEKNPDNYKGYVSLSAFYFKVGQKEKSIAVLNDVKTKFPESEKEMSKIISQIEKGENPLGQIIK